MKYTEVLIPANNFKVVKLDGKKFFINSKEYIILKGYGILDIAKNEYVSMSKAVKDGSNILLNCGNVPDAFQIPTTYDKLKTAKFAVSQGLYEGYHTVKVD